MPILAACNSGLGGTVPTPPGVGSEVLGSMPWPRTNEPPALPFDAAGLTNGAAGVPSTPLLCASAVVGVAAVGETGACGLRKPEPRRSASAWFASSSSLSRAIIGLASLEMLLSSRLEMFAGPNDPNCGIEPGWYCWLKRKRTSMAIAAPLLEQVAEQRVAGARAEAGAEQVAADAEAAHDRAPGVRRRLLAGEHALRAGADDLIVGGLLRRRDVARRARRQRGHGAAVLPGEAGDLGGVVAGQLQIGRAPVQRHVGQPRAGARVQPGGVGAGLGA